VGREVVQMLCADDKVFLAKKGREVPHSSCLLQQRASSVSIRVLQSLIKDTQKSVYIRQVPIVRTRSLGFGSVTAVARGRSAERPDYNPIQTNKRSLEVNVA
jgi:hypothetical protein